MRLNINDHSSTTERLGQRSLERRLVFKEEPEFETKFKQCFIKFNLL